MQKLGNERIQICGCTRQGLKVIPWVELPFLVGGNIHLFIVLLFFHRFSGITESDMEDVKTTILDVQAALLTRFSDKTILIGHSLESDFHALKVRNCTYTCTCRRCFRSCSHLGCSSVPSSYNFISLDIICVCNCICVKVIACSSTVSLSFVANSTR